ncbi:MAG: hypothetical protein FJY92_04930 [Candidatus Hydrogenedentes bacterium]|nr:hypothetical protein [Candidatus Hydrogenedentota bacterium]
MVGQASTATDGAFTISIDKPLTKGYVLVQPAATQSVGGIETYTVAPRIYAYHGETDLDIRLPAAACIVLRGYDAQGRLMRWEDFRKRGTIGDQFMYATDANDCTLEATCWPVFDDEARALGQPREKGLPALIVAPGAACVPQALFWETRGYGKLHLRADNAGAGFAPTSDRPVVVELNVELARTAVHDLARRFPGDARDATDALDRAMNLAGPVERAAAADAVLVDALRLRDRRELERARAAIASRPRRTDFSFGVFEGSPYNAHAFQTARDAGFDLATVLLGWNWTDAHGGAVDKAAIEQTFGIERLRKQGYALKAHGVVWLQDYGILPDRARAMAPGALRDALLQQEKALLDAYGDAFSVWEAMNEPNVTNIANAPRDIVADLLAKSAQQVSAREKLTALVNSAHEGDYGRRFAVYTLDNKPAHDWSRTYLAYLNGADAQRAVAQLDAVGLQYYPGFHFNESFGGLQGPATTPSWLIDTIDRYAALKKAIHITEFSVPSTYQPGWTSGYWREPWTEQTQADYAEAVFTLAYADERVHSITWWDITDTKSSVTTGGLCDANGGPKPVLERLEGLIAAWNSK